MRLSDVNDNSPRLLKEEWQLEVPETHGTGPPGDQSLLDLAVTDPDRANYFFYRVSHSYVHLSSCDGSRQSQLFFILIEQFMCKFIVTGSSSGSSSTIVVVNVGHAEFAKFQGKCWPTSVNLNNQCQQLPLLLY